jgi:hypothetical protein
MKEYFWSFLRFWGLGGHVAIHLSESELRTNGWFRSFDARQALDAQGQTIPWLTYPFIDFLSPRLRPEFTVCEFGAGSSTTWFAARCAQVVSIEHNEAWAARLRPLLTANVELRLATDPETYAQQAELSGKTFQLILIDGIERNACLHRAARSLAPDGVVILDNSDRIAEYLPGTHALAEAGFRRLDFWGMCPGISVKSCTTVFYRAGNVLGI